MAPVATEVWLRIAQFATLPLVLALRLPAAGRLDGPRVLQPPRRTWRIERGLYRVIGVDLPLGTEPGAGLHLAGACSSFSARRHPVHLPALQRVQAVSSPTTSGCPPTSEELAFNTATSFVTNTNWQSLLARDLTMGYTVQLAGLAVQNFVSAAVGIAVA